MNRQWILLWLLGLTAVAAGCRNDGEVVKRLNSNNAVVRLAAAREVAKAAAPRGIRGRLTSLLRGSPDGRVVEALIQRLKDPLPEVRIMATKALGNLKSRRAVPHLQESLKDDVPDVSREAVASLGKIGDRRALPALAGVLNDPGLGLTAIWSLGSIGDQEAISLLLPLVKSKDKYVRYNTMQALKRLR